MSGEVVLFLKNKFIDNFQEGIEGQNKLVLRKVFESIKGILEKKIKSCVLLDHTKDILMIDILYKLNDAIRECRMLSENRRMPLRSPYSLRDVFYLHKIWHRLSKLEKDLRKLTDANSTSSLSVTDQQIPDRSETPIVFGFDNRMEEIVTSIQEDSSSDGINKVGIVGMGGSGKTTLAQMVFDDDRVKKEFIPRIWVAPNKSDSLSEATEGIVKYLLKELGADEDDHNDDDDDDVQQEEKEAESNGVKETEPTRSLDDLLIRLHKQLSGKKYLIVFDDVWKINVWYKSLVENIYPSRGLPKGQGGGIIVTSRLAEDVKEMVKETNLYRLLPTSDDDCWLIFMEVIKENGINSEHPTLIKMKTEILENCNNLPLAAKTLGNVISGKILE